MRGSALLVPTVLLNSKNSFETNSKANNQFEPKLFVQLIGDRIDIDSILSHFRGTRNRIKYSLAERKCFSGSLTTYCIICCNYTDLWCLMSCLMACISSFVCMCIPWAPLCPLSVPSLSPIRSIANNLRHLFNNNNTFLSLWVKHFLFIYFSKSRSEALFCYHLPRISNQILISVLRLDYR